MATTTIAANAEALDPEIGAPGLGDPYFPDLGNGGYQVEHYDLAIDVDPEAGTLDAVATASRRWPTADLSGFNLDLIGLEVTAP